MECIVLAGGLGTRLQGVIGSYPKCMAPVNNKPFLHYLFEYLHRQHCTRVILSLGFKHEVIIAWLEHATWPFAIDYVIEEEPLGTGGGISLALSKATEPDVLVLNGDTMFTVQLDKLMAFHKNNNATTTLALKHMHDFNRYGTVKVDSQNRINSFEEKKQCDDGLINGGIYVLNKHALTAKQLPQKYSFEKDYLEAFVNENLFYGFEDLGYFIDIGIPEDYRKAQEDFKTLFA
jgi:D-glycero-alpha-D-manno-heptose 1-phosphate guanylyltransferase